MYRRISPQERSRRAGLSWVNPFPVISTVLIAAAVLTVGYKLGGNEHGVSKNPGANTIPDFPVGPMEGGANSDPSLIYDARTAARFVCGNTILVAKLPDGTDTLTVRPVRDPASPNPLVINRLGATGMGWERPVEGTTYKYYNIDGTPAKEDGLKGCKQEAITAVVVNTADPSSHPYVIAGEHSDVTDGSTISPDAQTAVDRDLVSFSLTGLNDATVAITLGNIQHHTQS